MVTVSRPEASNKIPFIFTWKDIPSIYPSIFPTIIRVVSQWKRGKQATPDISLLSTIFQLLLGDAEAFPSQMNYIIPPACSRSTPGSPTSCTCWENFKKEAPRRHSYQMPKPSQLAPFDADVWAPYLISKGEPSHLISPACICNSFFRSLSKARGHRWGLERLLIQSFAFRLSSLFATTVPYRNPLPSRGSNPLLS